MHQILTTHGYLVFSSYGEENFNEIKKTMNIGLKYNSLQEQINLLSPYFDIIHAEEWKECIPFANPREVLKHIKKTGVNALQKEFLGKEKLHAFSENYIRHFSNADESVNLTYHPIIIIAKKK
jgi:malonyl-CoA O-methyltransferase